MRKFTWYVAGPWADREAIVRPIIRKVMEAGYEVNSRWADPSNEDVAPDDPQRDEKLHEQALRDLENVSEADGLIYVNSSASEGKATELGVAIGLLMPVIIIGKKVYDERPLNNIFLRLNGIPAFETIEAALEWLEESDFTTKFLAQLGGLGGE